MINLSPTPFIRINDTRYNLAHYSNYSISHFINDYNNPIWCIHLEHITYKPVAPLKFTLKEDFDAVIKILDYALVVAEYTTKTYK